MSGASAQSVGETKFVLKEISSPQRSPGRRQRQMTPRRNNGAGLHSRISMSPQVRKSNSDFTFDPTPLDKGTIVYLTGGTEAIIVRMCSTGEYEIYVPTVESNFKASREEFTIHNPESLYDSNMPNEILSPPVQGGDFRNWAGDQMQEDVFARDMRTMFGIEDHHMTNMNSPSPVLHNTFNGPPHAYGGFNIANKTPHMYGVNTGHDGRSNGIPQVHHSMDNIQNENPNHRAKATTGKRLHSNMNSPAVSEPPQPLHSKSNDASNNVRNRNRADLKRGNQSYRGPGNKNFGRLSYQGDKWTIQPGGWRDGHANAPAKAAKTSWRDVISEGKSGKQEMNGKLVERRTQKKNKPFDAASRKPKRNEKRPTGGISKANEEPIVITSLRAMGKSQTDFSRICRHFLSTEGCRRGNKCRFHHPEDPLTIGLMASGEDQKCIIAVTPDKEPKGQKITLNRLHKANTAPSPEFRTRNRGIGMPKTA